MYVQGILIGSLLVFYSDKVIKKIGLDETTLKFNIIKCIILFLYITGIFLYFSMLNIEFDEDKLKEKKRYIGYSIGVAALCILAYIGITYNLRIRRKIEDLLGNPSKHINEYIIMTVIFNIGVLLLYLIEII